MRTPHGRCAQRLSVGHARCAGSPAGCALQAEGLRAGTARTPRRCAAAGVLPAETHVGRARQRAAGILPAPISRPGASYYSCAGLRPAGTAQTRRHRAASPSESYTTRSAASLPPPSQCGPLQEVRTTLAVVHARAIIGVPVRSGAPAREALSSRARRAGWSSVDKRSRHGGRRSVGGSRSSAGRRTRPSMRNQGPEGAAMNSRTHARPIPSEAGRMPAGFGAPGLRGSKPAGRRPPRCAWALFQFRRAGPRPEERSRPRRPAQRPRPDPSSRSQV